MSRDSGGFVGQASCLSAVRRARCLPHAPNAQYQKLVYKPSTPDALDLAGSPSTARRVLGRVRLAARHVLSLHPLARSRGRRRTALTLANSCRGLVAFDRHVGVSVFHIMAL